MMNHHHARLALASAFMLTLALGASVASAGSLIVKLRSEGPHAVVECAETITKEGRGLAGATADGSVSLDALLDEHRVGRVRAVFRRPDGRAFALQQDELRRRAADARARHPARSRRGKLPLRDAAELAHVYKLELPADANVAAAVDAFAADPHVEYAQPNYAVSHDRLLDDPFLLPSDASSPVYSYQWGVARIGVPEAWDTTLGEGTVIAIVDTGIDTRHPDLVANLWVHPGEDLNHNGVADPEEWNNIDDDGNGFIDDLHGYDFHDAVDANEDGDFADPEDISDPDPFDRNGHGTHVAGIAAARGDNGIGISGVAPRARVMGVKVFPDSGNAETERVWRGVLYAAENGADVINASFSCSPRCPDNPLGEEIARRVRELGVVFVTSAGNRSDDATLTSPERLPETLVVGATTAGDELAAFSSFGFGVDLVAPGREVLSLRIENPELWSPIRFVGDAYMYLNGTSMSAPHVAGVAALLLSASPELSVDEVRDRLRRTAEDSGAPGPDREFANGWVRPDRAVTAVLADAGGRIDAPLPGTRIDTDAQPLNFRARVFGDDVATAQLELGRGSDPQAWTLLDEAASCEMMVSWDPGEVVDGRFVLRLTVEATDGELIREYAPFSLDRNRPRFLSSPENEASQPDIAGTRVVWSEQERLEDDELGDRDLMLGDFDAEGGVPVVIGPGDQFAARLTRSALSWLDRPPEQGGGGRDGISGCLLSGNAARCSVTEVLPSSPVPRFGSALAGRQLVFTKQAASGYEILGCRLSKRGCMPAPMAPIVSFFSEPRYDGERLLWVERDGFTLSLSACRTPGKGTCTPVPLDVERDFHLEAKALSGSLVAFEDIDDMDIFRLTDPVYRLNACRLDLATGACPAVEIARSSVPFVVDASSDRLVWHGAGENDELDVFTCRFDAQRLTCPAQRVTNDPASQQAPRIDGHRVLWQDDREGPARIASFSLPRIASLRDRSVRVGKTTEFTLKETSGGGPVLLEAWTDTGAPAESLGMDIAQRPSGAFRVSWSPGEANLGSHLLHFRAVRASGLYDERSIRIDVLPRKK